MPAKEFDPKNPATTADMADLLLVHLNVWSVLETICRELPKDCAAQTQLEISRKGMTDALASIVRRHAMDITWDHTSHE